MDFTVINDCKLGKVYSRQVKRNDEVVGEKTMVDVLTWGERIAIEIDSNFSKELKVGVIGRATIQGEVASKSEVRRYDGHAYATDTTYFRFDKLTGFEPGK